MSNHPHAIDRVLSLAFYPWAITPPMLHTIALVLARRLTAGPQPLAVELPRRSPSAPPPKGSTVALLPLYGCIAPRMTALTDISGGATFEEFTATLGAAVADPDVGTIVVDVDSPGGSVLGARVAARAMLAARTKKPVVAQVHYEMCSAAYWVCACATEIVAAPGALTGSIGVFTIHDNLAKALEQDGIERELIAAGKHKLDANAFQPLTEDARARLKGLVDENYGHFVADVAAGRGRTADEVRNGFGEGAVVSAESALSLGMIDRIATLDDTLARFGASTPARALALTADTPQEPPKATGQDRAAQMRELQLAMLALDCKEIQC